MQKSSAEVALLATSYEDHLPVRLTKAAEAMAVVARLLLGENHGFGFTELRMLAYLAERRCASVADISRDLQVDKAWISRLLQGFCAKQLVVKARDPTDSRVILASITEAGRSLHQTMLSDVARHNDALMAGVDQELAGAIMLRLEANARELAARLRSEGRPGERGR